ncbi:MAG: hypothetical protein A2X49_12545 [Lentisphaerae bacterium GWF2_52_8]|nr:MAG: hypothetical protein A2X49_12545 [Lentisphaerae bacterium GWF2_52_8]
MLLTQTIRLAVRLALVKAGRRIEAKITIMTITIRSSMSVKGAALFLELQMGNILFFIGTSLQIDIRMPH